MAKDTKFYDLLGVSLDHLTLNRQLYLTNHGKVSPSCTEAELKKAYKIGALKHHPGS